jgi:hypothetical protein
LVRRSQQEAHLLANRDNLGGSWPRANCRERCSPTSLSAQSAVSIFVSNRSSTRRDPIDPCPTTRENRSSSTNSVFEPPILLPVLTITILPEARTDCLLSSCNHLSFISMYDFPRVQTHHKRDRLRAMDSAVKRRKSVLIGAFFCPISLLCQVIGRGRRG